MEFILYQITEQEIFVPEIRIYKLFFDQKNTKGRKGDDYDLFDRFDSFAFSLG